ncbi:MAG: hypothetical protein V3W18_06730 [candidate division Zixibacteria bacterium]
MPSPEIPDLIQAGLFSFLGGLLTEKSIAALGTILLIYLGYVVKKELIPFLKVRRNKEMAQHVLLIADDVTDYFRLKFPQAHWSVWLDRAVDRIIDITGIGKDGARRAAQASMARKKANSDKDKIA